MNQLELDVHDINKNIVSSIVEETGELKIPPMFIYCSKDGIFLSQMGKNLHEVSGTFSDIAIRPTTLWWSIIYSYTPSCDDPMIKSGIMDNNLIGHDVAVVLCGIHSSDDISSTVYDKDINLMSKKTITNESLEFLTFLNFGGLN
jgi:hypothetical protein